MKTTDILIYGGLAYLGYTWYVKHKQATTSPPAVSPYIPTASASVLPSSGTNLLNTATNTVGTLFKQLFPSAPAPVNTNPVSTPSVSPVTNFSPAEQSVLFPASQFNPPPLLNTSFNLPNTSVVSSSSTSLVDNMGPFSSDTQYLQSLDEADTMV